MKKDNDQRTGQLQSLYNLPFHFAAERQTIWQRWQIRTPQAICRLMRRRQRCQNYYSKQTQMSHQIGNSNGNSTYRELSASKWDNDMRLNKNVPPAAVSPRLKYKYLLFSGGCKCTQILFFFFFFCKISELQLMFFIYCHKKQATNSDIGQKTKSRGFFF